MKIAWEGARGPGRVAVGEGPGQGWEVAAELTPGRQALGGPAQESEGQSQGPRASGCPQPCGHPGDLGLAPWAGVKSQGPL